MNGISYANGENNTGFIQVPEVTLRSPIDHLVYTLNSWDPGTGFGGARLNAFVSEEEENVVIVENVITETTTNLHLDIPANVTLKWGASVSGSNFKIIFSAGSSGTLEIAADGMIERTTDGYIIEEWNNNDTIFTSLYVTGGTVRGRIVFNSFGKIVIEDGVVEKITESTPPFPTISIGEKSGGLEISGGVVTGYDNVILYSSSVPLKIAGGMIVQLTDRKSVV